MRARRVTAKQALSDFLNTFVGGTEVDGKVTRREFFEYYANVGAYVDNDAYFDLLVRGVWGVEAAATRLEALPAAPAAPLRSALRTALSDTVPRERPSPSRQQQQQRPLSATAPLHKKWSPVPGANQYHVGPAAPPPHHCCRRRRWRLRHSCDFVRRVEPRVRRRQGGAVKPRVRQHFDVRRRCRY